MRTLTLRAVAAIAIIAIAWSCKEDGSDSDREPTLEELPGRFVDALCPELERCLGESSSERLFGDGGCEARLRAQLEDGDFAATQEAVQAGRVHYDASQVSACLAAIDGIGCGFQTTRTLMSEHCNLVLEGDVALGGNCALDEDCAGVAFCKRNGESCPGTCSALLGANESCTSDDECAEGLACPDSVSRCVAPGRLGEACGGTGDAVCAAGLICLATGTAAGAPRECGDPEELFVAQLGDDCDPEAEILCVDDLACAIVLPLEVEPRFRCMQLVTTLGDGCTFGAPSQCPKGSYCSGLDITAGDIEGSCAALPEDHDACNMEGGGATCSDGLICDTDGLCHAIGRLGDDCASDRACASRHCEDGTCTRPETCTLGAEE